MLDKYTVKRQILRWPLAFFDNIDITGLACYIIYREHNLRFKAKEQQRKFLKKRDNMLCMPSIQARSNSRMLMRNHFLQGAVETVLGRYIMAPKKMLLLLMRLMAVVDQLRSFTVVVSAETR